MNKIRRRNSLLALFYWYKLKFNTNKEFLTISEIWPSDVEKGQQLLKGRLAIDDENHPLFPYCWENTEASIYWLEELYSFNWLKHIKATNSEEGRRFSRALIQGWLKYRPRSNHRGDITGNRIAAWLTNAEYFLAGADNKFRHDFFIGIIKETAEIMAERNIPADGRKFNYIKGLIYACLSLSKQNLLYKKNFFALEIEAKKQIMQDGSHIERSPLLQLKILQQFIDIYNAIRKHGLNTPEFIIENIKKMFIPLAFFCHPNKELAAFNGGGEGLKPQIEAIFSTLVKQNIIPQKFTMPKKLADSGYHRIETGATFLICDTSENSLNTRIDYQYQGAFSFETSINKEKIITNASLAQPLKPPLPEIAHSTICFIIDGAEQNFLDCDNVSCERHEEIGSSLLILKRNIYIQKNIVRHQRLIFVSADGKQIKGQDDITWPEYGLAGRNIILSINFHLHPKIHAQPQSDRKAILISTEKKRLYQFMASKNTVTTLKNSVYQGLRAKIFDSSSINVKTEINTCPLQIKWALHKISDRIKKNEEHKNQTSPMLDIK